ncbi:hypothetical protein LSH36_164g01065 [Paralvinella palmiformis]|uniref:Uncharacterized protein n=1 Tax=Paralvinella palmiformis TaxID=53620 RepID=A0AAD9JU98_9ANNE|nr:hypothetical protein LSH36_164g01065 [Paralvinella palmiformis]
MADVNKKRVRIWILVKRLDLSENDTEDKKQPNVTDVYFDTSYTTEEMAKTIRKTVNLDDGLVLKLRNHRGSLIPINSQIASNAKSVPYTLEVVKHNQHIKPRQRSLKCCRQVDALLVAYNNIKSRTDHIEAAIPNLMNMRREIIINDVREMEKTLTFLEKRLKTAEDTSWQGMFKKCPFW